MLLPRRRHVSFKKQFDIETRKAYTEHIRMLYPDKVPVIVERAKKSNLNDLDKSKYLMPPNFSIGEFYFLIKKHIQIDPEEPLFFIVNNYVPPTNATIGSLHTDYHEEDLFLYITYTNKNFFGFSGIIPKRRRTFMSFK